MEDIESYVRALGLNSLIRSYDHNSKKLGIKYIKEHFTDIPDMLEHLDDQAIIEVVKAHKSDIKQWIVERAAAEAKNNSKLVVIGGENE